jgi:hypothetical protein
MLRRHSGRRGRTVTVGRVAMVRNMKLMMIGQRRWWRKGKQIGIVGQRHGQQGEMLMLLLLLLSESGRVEFQWIVIRRARTAVVVVEDGRGRRRSAAAAASRPLVLLMVTMLLLLQLLLLLLEIVVVAAHDDGESDFVVFLYFRALLSPHGPFAHGRSLVGPAGWWLGDGTSISIDRRPERRYRGIAKTQRSLMGGRVTHGPAGELHKNYCKFRSLYLLKLFFVLAKMVRSRWS